MSHEDPRSGKTARDTKHATKRDRLTRVRATRAPSPHSRRTPEAHAEYAVPDVRDRVRRLACLPIPAFLVAIAALWIADIPGTFDPPFLLIGLNFVFSTLVSLFVAYLIARSFLVRGQPALLMLGCGVVVWGLAGVAAVTAGRDDINIVVTIHNAAVCLSAACHLLGACFAVRLERTIRAAGLSIAAGYAAALGAVVLVALAALAGWMPVFFIQGYGGTPVRQLVLASATGMFVLTAIMLGGPNRRPLSGFRYWYTLALALITAGLLGVMTETSHGSVLNWTGRAAQFLSGVYMLVAAIAAVRESHVWGISLGEALRESEKRFKVLAAASFEGIAITEEGRFTDANEQLLEMLGYSREELLALHVGNVIPVDQRARVLRSMLAGQKAVIEHDVVRKDGTRISIEARGRTIQYPDRRVRITAIRDVTQRKRWEQQLRHLTRRLEALMRALPVGVSFSDDATCQRVTGNPAVLAQFEIGPADNLSASAPEGDAAGRNVRYFHTGRELRAAELPLQRALAENAEIPPMELEVQLPSGRRWFADASGAPVRDERGKVVAGVAVTVDITQRKQMELEVERAKEAAETASRAKDEFLAVLSHELRTPLTPVLLTACLLERRNDLPADVRRDLQSIRRNVELEARIIDDLLDLTSIAHGKLRFDFRPTDLHVLVSAAAEICGRGQGAPIQLDLAARDHFVNGDPARLQQLFWNLLSNARKFTPAAGRIVVQSSDLPSPGIRVEVTDTGAGIEPEALPRIFGAFEQGNSRRARQFGGLGLGLAICKAVAEAHGGAIRACSAGRGLGAAFTVELPTVAPPEGELPKVIPVTAAQSAGTSLRVLVVEDHQATLQVIARLIQGLGHVVQTAVDVASALRVAEQWQFDLLISDLGLPDGTGYDLMRRLSGRTGLFGIALSGFGMEQDVRQSKEAGFKEHLTKPVDFDLLEAVVSRIATASAANGASTPSA